MEAKKILVVDDEADLLVFVKARLEKNNFSVLTALDGQQALELVRKEKPDLIILDILLPKMDGFDVCDRLKKDPEFKKIPIIMLTAKDQPKDVQLAKKLGADAYISKPFESDILLYDVKRLIK